MPRKPSALRLLQTDSQTTDSLEVTVQTGAGFVSFNRGGKNRKPCLWASHFRLLGRELWMACVAKLRSRNAEGLHSHPSACPELLPCQQAQPLWSEGSCLDPQGVPIPLSHGHTGTSSCCLWSQNLHPGESDKSSAERYQLTFFVIGWS